MMASVGYTAGQLSSWSMTWCGNLNRSKKLAGGLAVQKDISKSGFPFTISQSSTDIRGRSGRRRYWLKSWRGERTHEGNGLRFGEWWTKEKLIYTLLENDGVEVGITYKESRNSNGNGESPEVEL